LRQIKHQETIYKSAYRSFFLLCVRYCGSEETAKEVFNDAMLKYFKYEKSNKVNEKGRYSLIKKIIVNQCIDFIRKKQMEFTEIGEAAFSDYHHNNEAEYNLRKEEMLALIKDFPPQTRLVFNLYIFEGWSHKEIAEEMNISIHTSNWHVNAGKKRILALLTTDKSHAK
jgi:RNA polymerase sigma factor (sigma-70 family)